MSKQKEEYIELEEPVLHLRLDNETIARLTLAYSLKPHYDNLNFLDQYKYIKEYLDKLDAEETTK